MLIILTVRRGAADSMVLNHYNCTYLELYDIIRGEETTGDNCTPPPPHTHTLCWANINKRNLKHGSKTKYFVQLT